MYMERIWLGGREAISFSVKNFEVQQRELSLL